MTYTPTFDTTVRTKTETSRVNTMHTDSIDWDYPFNDPANTDCMCCGEDEKKRRIEEYKDHLRTCERCKDQEVFASNYGGWPRIWARVFGVGMASAWPYWKPRPVIIVESPLGGTEWYDWHSLTGARIKEQEPAAAGHDNG